MTSPADNSSVKPSLPIGYAELLDQLKGCIRKAQMRATLAVNRELIQLYWDIGKAIAERQRVQGWGRSVVEQLAADLQAAFPGVAGFSPQNVWKMRAFFLAWTDEPTDLSQAVRDLNGMQPPPLVTALPWGHNMELIFKLKEPALRSWYAKQALAHGWSRAALVHQLETELHLRQGHAVTNFSSAMPPPQSELAQQLLKDPYQFDFLALGPEAKERELEQGLLAHIRRFLLELGAGFAFVGQQVHLAVGDEDFYIDLLFYHLKLRCYLIAEPSPHFLKISP